MKVFINEIAVNITHESDFTGLEHYTMEIDGALEAINPSKLVHNVLITNVTEGHIDELLDLLHANVLRGLHSITLSVSEYDIIKSYFKSKYKIIRAAGGLVRKGNKVLMIYRLKKWDLPKGKLKRNEKPRIGAVREVEEECNIKVKSGQKICNTWHTYTMNNKNMLKKTSWFLMDLEDDSTMRPQKEEDIEEVKFLAPKDIYVALKSSYHSIHFVFDCYFKMQKKKTH
jgi:8-oxo-(d)GTP phosphatase